MDDPNQANNFPITPECWACKTNSRKYDKLYARYSGELEMLIHGITQFYLADLYPLQKDNNNEEFSSSGEHEAESLNENDIPLAERGDIKEALANEEYQSVQ